MIWQDFVVGACNLAFLVALIPMALSPRTRVPFWTGVLTTVGILTSAATLLTLDLIFTPVVMFGTAYCWAKVTYTAFWNPL